MSSGSFSFPPPPPPPPPSQSSPGNFASGGRPQHGQGFRGRGSGRQNRGGGRGNPYNSGPGNHPRGGGGRGAPRSNYGPPRGGGNSFRGNHPYSQYGQHRSFQYGQTYTAPDYLPPRPPFQQAPFSTNTSAPPTAYDSSNLEHNPTHQLGFFSHQQHDANIYSPYSGLSANINSQNPNMGAQMHWGPDQLNPNAQHTHHANQTQFANANITNPNRPNQARAGQRFHSPHIPPTHSSGPRYGADKQLNRSSKRPHSSAFGTPTHTSSRPSAPPAVPSFGNPLPSKPPLPTDATRTNKKKQRKYNQLGLTPKTEEHESSEEEEDVDEEAKFSHIMSGGGLKFTYKGRTSVLQSPSDIATWIQERKKKYPTQARVEERQKELEARKLEAQKAREERKAQQEEYKLKQREMKSKNVKEKVGQKTAREDTSSALDTAAKAKEKAERLRRKLEKEERKLAKAEANAEKAKRIQADKPKPLADGHSYSTAESGGQANPGDLASFAGDNSGEAVNRIDGDGLPQYKNDNGVVGDSYAQLGIGGSESYSSEMCPQPSDDETSSSGSDSSSLSSSEESDDDDSGPEIITARRQQPDRVAPPTRQKAIPSQSVCREFSRTGHCRRKEKCKYLHKLSELPNKKKGGKISNSEKGRKSLFQAVCFDLFFPVHSFLNMRVYRKSVFCRLLLTFILFSYLVDRT